MRWAMLAAASLGLLALSGCASDDGTTDAVQTTPAVQYEDEVVQVAAPTMPRDPPAAGERTLDAAPQWRLGEWWKYFMTDEFTGKTTEFLRVVAGEDRAAGNYLVGFPVEAFSNDVMVLHVPGYGDIRQADLAYETHDAYFEPLQFPLAEGNTWEMSFEGVANGLATVSLPGDGTARITMEVSQYGWINATYDPAIGEVSELSINGYGEYRVIDHGYGYQGVVRVPHAHDLLMQTGRIAGALVNLGIPPATAGPTETVEVGEGYDRFSFILAVGAGPFLGLDPAVPVGVFQETATAPDGTQYQLQLLPHEGGFKIEAFGHDNPAGAWNLQHVAAGAGIAFIEGIGYHSIDVELPSGCVVASFNAQHHNADCTVNRDVQAQIA